MKILTIETGNFYDEVRESLIYNLVPEEQIDRVQTELITRLGPVTHKPETLGYDGKKYGDLIENNYIITLAEIVITLRNNLEGNAEKERYIIEDISKKISSFVEDSVYL